MLCNSVSVCTPVIIKKSQSAIITISIQILSEQNSSSDALCLYGDNSINSHHKIIQQVIANNHKLKRKSVSDNMALFCMEELAFVTNK